MTSERHAIAADRVFDGEELHHDHAVVVAGGRIEDLVPRRDVPDGVPVRDLPGGAWIAPGFIDVQVNGGGDVLLNDSPTPEGVAAIAAAHRRFGTTGLLPTLISDTAEQMAAAAAAVAEIMPHRPEVLGIHFEGPFLSPEKPGVHAPAMLRAPTSGDEALLTARRSGATMVTLAPERVPPGFIGRLARRGVRVCLGHSMASYSETLKAIDEGMTGFTHLFNAMRPMAAREPGPIAAALERPDVWFGMIVDLLHVDPVMLRLALRGRAHPVLVTDAMPPVGGTRSTFRLYGEEISVEDGRCRRSDGTLAGAALDMATAVRNAVRVLDMPLTAALRAASAEPAAFLGLDDQLGRLRSGCRADLLAFEPETISVIDTWVAGQSGNEDVLR